jgi:phage terminase small subunit
LTITRQQHRFIDAYLQCFNAAEAARRAGYSAPGARQRGSELLARPEIAAEIAARVTELAMSADEALVRLGQQARASLEDFLDIGEDGSAQVDLTKAQRAGVLHLLKSYKPGEWGTEIGLHDAQAALFKIAQVHGLLKDRIEHTGKDGGPIQHDSRELSDERGVALIVAILDRARARLDAPGGHAGELPDLDPTAGTTA